MNITLENFANTLDALMAKTSKLDMKGENYLYTHNAIRFIDSYLMPSTFSQWETKSKRKVGRDQQCDHKKPRSNRLNLDPTACNKYSLITSPKEIHVVFKTCDYFHVLEH